MCNAATTSPGRRRLPGGFAGPADATRVAFPAPGPVAPEIVEKLNRQVRMALNAPDVSDKLKAAGTEPVEGNPAYKLKITAKNGDVQHIWIDAQSFLDVKVEGSPRRMDGRMHTVWVYQRDFRTVQGVTMPFVLETAVDGYRETHKIVIEKVTVNPKLDDSLFAKPKV